MNNDIAKQRAEMPIGTNKILNKRNLKDNFSRLFDILTPNKRVLDVGCGGGAITHGIAEAVGKGGEVVGVDINKRLVNDARRGNQDLESLRFLQSDIYQLPFENEFDIVVAARVFQWLNEPMKALCAMIRAAKLGGLVLVLDYNHEKLKQWPSPPTELIHFYEKYLSWRKDAGMNNTIADSLETMFREADLQNIKVTPQHETTLRNESDFMSKISLKVDVVATRGTQMVKEGWLTEKERMSAELSGQQWITSQARGQTLYLLAVEGKVAENNV